MEDERRIRMDDGEGSEADGATAIVLRFGDMEVPAHLNGTETARAFADRLPVTVDVSGTGVDFCGRMPFSLPYDEAQVHDGWTNGDLNYNPRGDWLAVLFGGEEGSAAYDDRVTMGAVDGPLSVLEQLEGAFALRIEAVA